MVGLAPASPTIDLPRQERRAILAALLSLAALSWLYLLWQPAALMPASPGMGAMPEMAATPGLRDLTLGIVMWWIMMPGMMLPSAAPMVLTFAMINRGKSARGETAIPTAIFALGYLVLWSLFGIAAGIVGWALERAWASPIAMGLAPAAGATIALAAGVYQLTPLKTVCLDKCRSPLAFVMMHWREGRMGAFRMGAAHGLYCLGCCWLLMGLLFAAGTMNLLAVATLAALVFAEKLLPGGRWVARLSGVAMIALGLWLATTAL
jgi:predicted metal-binding membrane protein